MAFFFQKEGGMSTKRRWWVLAAVIAIQLVSIVSVHAGTATVTGKVTYAGGAAVSNAEVCIRITDVLGMPDFPWAKKTVFTNASGVYTASVNFPDIVEIGIHVQAMKTDTLPFRQGSNIVSFYGTPPVNGRTYTLNIGLKNYPYAALIKGRVIDAQSGVPISDGDVAISKPGDTGKMLIFTDADGSFKGLVDVGSVSDVVILSPSAGHSIKYIAKKITMKMSEKKIYTADFSLYRDNNAGLMYGKVTDAKTGNPIPFAVVSISSPGGWPLGTPVTDYLGNYQQNTYGYPGGVEYKVSTFGAHTMVPARSKYRYYSKGVFVKAGDRKRVDFSMTLNTP
jgi:hypothetical protein